MEAIKAATENGQEHRKEMDRMQDKFCGEDGPGKENPICKNWASGSSRYKKTRDGAQHLKIPDGKNFKDMMKEHKLVKQGGDPSPLAAGAAMKGKFAMQNPDSD